uniref:Uncharacterized protein n=1 Tax=Timema cristinae TaxID=61476 RepID=A0A7R9CHK9_TIMCR|nr:unnamed protein product [Timema cristinae]
MWIQSFQFLIRLDSPVDRIASGYPLNHHTSAVHPTEIRTLISPSSAVELNTTSALVNYATEAAEITDWRLRCADHMTPSSHICWNNLDQEMTAAWLVCLDCGMTMEVESSCPTQETLVRTAGFKPGVCPGHIRVAPSPPDVYDNSLIIRSTVRRDQPPPSPSPPISPYHNPPPLIAQHQTHSQATITDGRTPQFQYRQASVISIIKRCFLDGRKPDFHCSSYRYFHSDRSDSVSCLKGATYRTLKRSKPGHQRDPPTTSPLLLRSHARAPEAKNTPCVLRVAVIDSFSDVTARNNYNLVSLDSGTLRGNKKRGGGEADRTKIGEEHIHPTEIRTSISPSSAVEFNTTSALANYATEAEPIQGLQGQNVTYGSMVKGNCGDDVVLWIVGGAPSPIRHLSRGVSREMQPSFREPMGSENIDPGVTQMSQCRGFSIQDMFPEVVLNSVHEFSNALVKLNPTNTGRWVLKSIFGIPQLVLDSVEVTVSNIAWHGMVWLETKIIASPKLKEALNESNDYWKVLFAVNHLLEFGDAIKFMDKERKRIKEIRREEEIQQECERRMDRKLTRSALRPLGLAPKKLAQ